MKLIVTLWSSIPKTSLLNDHSGLKWFPVRKIASTSVKPRDKINSFLRTDDATPLEIHVSLILKLSNAIPKPVFFDL